MRFAATRAQRLLAEDRGTVTAEFAVVLPAVLAVLGLVVGAVLLAASRITLIAGAAELARLEARGDHAAAAATIAELDGAIDLSRSDDGPLHCVTLRRSPGTGMLASVGVEGRSCAATIGADP